MAQENTLKNDSLITLLDKMKHTRDQAKSWRSRTD